MAAAIDLSTGGGGGGNDITGLIRALDGYTSALSRIGSAFSGNAGHEAPEMPHTAVPKVEFSPHQPSPLRPAPAPVMPQAPARGRPAPAPVMPEPTAAQRATKSLSDRGLGKYGDMLRGEGMDIAGGLAKQAKAAGGLLGKLGGGAGIALKGLTRLAGPVGVAMGVVDLAKQIPVVGDLIGLGETALMLPLRRLGGAMATMMVPMRLFQTKIGVMTTGLEMAGKASYAYANVMGSVSTHAADSVKLIMSSVTDIFSDPIKVIPQMIGQLRPFIEAFNPAVILEFDMAMRSVYAIMGESLVPVVRAASSVVRQFAAYLKPLMEILTPILEEMANSVGGFLKEMMPELAKFAKELGPVLKLYLASLKEQMRAQMKATQSQLSWWQWLTGAKAEKKKDDNEPPPAPISAYGAATNPSFKSAADLGKELTLASFSASGVKESAAEKLAREARDLQAQAVGIAQAQLEALKRIGGLAPGVNRGEGINKKIIEAGKDWQNKNGIFPALTAAEIADAPEGMGAFAGGMGI